jgi:hypothetical protein
MSLICIGKEVEAIFVRSFRIFAEAFVCRLGGIRSVNIYGMLNHTMKFLRMDDWWGKLLVTRFGADFLG